MVAMNDYKDIAELLIACGANVHSKDNVRSLLNLISHYNYYLHGLSNFESAAFNLNYVYL